MIAFRPSIGSYGDTRIDIRYGEQAGHVSFSLGLLVHTVPAHASLISIYLSPRDYGILSSILTSSYEDLCK